VNDDGQQNRFQVTEHYSIDNAWGQPDKAGRYRIDFYPATIAALLKKPVDQERRLPLGINFPQHQILRTEVTLPQTWTADAEKKAVNDPAFTLRKDCRCGGNRLVMEYEYQSLADSVSPQRVGQYLQHLNQSLQSLGYGLTWR